MQATTHTERRYWHLARRRQTGQPWGCQNTRSGAIPFPPLAMSDDEAAALTDMGAL